LKKDGKKATIKKARWTESNNKERKKESLWRFHLRGARDTWQHREDTRREWDAGNGT